MKSEFSEPRFSEKWCSGRSDRNALARLAIAKNIPWVTVTNKELHVSPHFPFSLMFLPEAFGLHHRIPGRTILDVQEVSSTSLGRGVLVKYRHATGDEENLELWVSDAPTLRGHFLRSVNRDYCRFFFEQEAGKAHTLDLAVNTANLVDNFGIPQPASLSR